METPTLDSRTFDTDGDGDRWTAVVTGDTVVQESSPVVGDRLGAAIADADLSVTNLEAPIPPEDGTPIEKIGPTNETVPETPTYLREFGFDAVTLANNHTADYGPAGLDRTVERCEAADLDVCGLAGPDVSGAETVTRTVAGQSVTVVNLCEREFGAAAGGESGTARIGRPGTERRIEALATESDALVVVVHGGIEYVPLPPPRLQARLRAFAAAGADLVVGHHPHVPQGWECHADTPILYSVGNFRYTRCCRPKTEWGLLCSATFRGADLEAVSLHPVERVEDDGVQFVGERWDPDRFRSYLETASDIVADRERLRAHWQAQALAVFDQRYASWLRFAGGSNPSAILRNPGRYVGRGGLWDPGEREHGMLMLLNLVRNESHRAVIETAMAVRSGRREDRRTPAVRERVRTLLDTTEDEPLDGPRSPLALARRALSARLPDRIGGVGDRPGDRGANRDA